MVAIIRRWCLLARNTRYQIPCHVPVALKEQVLAYITVQGSAVTHELPVLDGDGETGANEGRLDVGLGRVMLLDKISV